jgi:hypothetical protein
MTTRDGFVVHSLPLGKKVLERKYDGDVSAVRLSVIDDNDEPPSSREGQTTLLVVVTYSSPRESLCHTFRV